jgi:methyl-accepting chemotaxis protein
LPTEISTSWRPASVVKTKVGDIAQAVETFKVKSAEKARAEAQANADRDLQAAAARAEQERLAAEEHAAQEREAAVARDEALAQVMNEFDAAVGGIAKAATAGDFSQRVALEGKEGVIRSLAESMNLMCDNIGHVLDDLVGMLSAMADGDLTHRIAGDYSGTFAILQDAANLTAEGLSQTISEIKSAALEVSNAAAEISASTTDLSQRTEEQAAGLEQTSASMEQISVTVRKNAENARQATTLATGTHKIADRGGAVVAETVGAMARIEESSRKISNIIGVIDEIARQTNLLALNAAVEAARAGEAGRGFAVVASEVRSLAQRSSQAAKDIKDLITSSSGQVKEGVDLVNRSGNSLTEIVESIKTVSEIVSDIATASAEQATGIDQIKRALDQMDEVTQQNSALVEQNAATAQTLEEQSRAMDARVSVFRVDPAHAVAALAKTLPVRTAYKTANVERMPVRAAAGSGRGGPVARLQAGVAAAFKTNKDFVEF